MHEFYASTAEPYLASGKSELLRFGGNLGIVFTLFTSRSRVPAEAAPSHIAFRATEPLLTHVDAQLCN